MKYSKLFLTLINLLFFFFGPAQHVTELHYKTVMTKTNKILEGPVFIYGKDFIKTQTKPAHSRNPARYIDKKNGLVIMDFEGSRDYIIEELDSVYRIDAKLEDAGEEKVINGYKCRKFTSLVERTYTMHVSYKMIMWITTDLIVDESYSIYVSHALFPMVATFPFKGVMVKVEYETSLPAKYQAYTILDQAVTDKEPQQDFVRPWLKTYEKDRKPVAILPSNNSNDPFGKATSNLVGPGSSTSNPSSAVSSSPLSTLPYTQENTRDQFRRMKGLLIKVTGIEKPDWKGGFEGILF